MSKFRGPGLALVAVGVTFIVIGASGQIAFIGVGLAFVVIGMAVTARRARNDENAPPN